MTAGVTVDEADIDAQVDRILDRGFRQYVGSEMARLMEPQVPRRTGALRDEAVTGELYVEYGGSAGEYARYQYELRSGNRTTPGTDGHWDDLTFPRRDGDLSRSLQEYVRGH